TLCSGEIVTEKEAQPFLMMMMMMVTTAHTERLATGLHRCERSTRPKPRPTLRCSVFSVNT
ncbi:hypothetical protein P7K49_014828, partial [Saguinus oedipus]